MNEVKLVEVNDEPNHQEVFQNQFIRIYKINLEPGRDTLYHRHSKDTLYIVLEGGLMFTYVIGKQTLSSVSFPKSFGLLQKIRFLLNNYFFRTAKLDTSLFLFQHHRDYPVVHKVIASAKNVNNIQLIGIEILEENIQHPTPSFDHMFYTKEYCSKVISIFRLKLKPGRSTDIHTCNFPGMTVVIEGSCTILTQKYSPKSHQLKAGDYEWHDCLENRNIINSSTTNLVALLFIIGC